MSIPPACVRLAGTGDFRDGNPRPAGRWRPRTASRCSRRHRVRIGTVQQASEEPLAAQSGAIRTSVSEGRRLKTAACGQYGHSPEWGLADPGRRMIPRQRRGDVCEPDVPEYGVDDCCIGDERDDPHRAGGRAADPPARPGGSDGPTGYVSP